MTAAMARRRQCRPDTAGPVALKITMAATAAALAPELMPMTSGGERVAQHGLEHTAGQAEREPDQDGHARPGQRSPPR